MIVNYYFGMNATNEKEAIDKIGQKMYELGLIDKKYIRHMHKRNKLTNVYMGNYLAIPHGLNKSDPLIKKSGIVISKLKNKIQFFGNDVVFVIGIAVKRKDQSEILQKIAIKFLNKDKIEKLIGKTNDEVKKFFASIEK